MEKKTNNLTSGFNFSAVSVTMKTEDNHLARLVTTFAVKYVPMTATQRDLEKLHAPAYPNMSPDEAMKEYNLAIKAVPVKNTVTGFFPALIREHDVQVGLSSITVEGSEIIPAGGSLEALTGVSVMAREVSNIVMAYTSQQQDYVSEPVDSKKASEIRIPHLSIKPLRSLINVKGGDNMILRDEMYEKLRSDDIQSRCALLYMMTTIYSNPELKSLSESNPKLLEVYKKKKPKDLPPLSEIRVPSVTAFTGFSITDPVKAWRFACKSVATRGGRRGKGASSVGYYRFDMPSSEVELCDEMTDLYNLLLKTQMEAVFLGYPSIPLTRLLLRNNITVYCPALSSQVAKADSPVGCYSRGTKKALCWMSFNQTSPTLAGSSISMPDPTPMPTNQVCYVYEYIPLHPEKNCVYLPSIRASEGLCIKTNQQVEGVPLDKLLARFSLAVYYRNWYIFTRITFVSQDVYRSHFSYQWVYPKVLMQTKEDLFSSAVACVVEKKGLQLIKSSIYSEVDIEEALEVDESKNDEIVATFEQYLTTVSTKDLAFMLKELSKGTLAVTPELSGVYNILSRSDLAEVIHDEYDRRNDVNEDEPPPETANEEDHRDENDREKSDTDDINDGDVENFFDEAAVRTVKNKSVPT